MFLVFFVFFGVTKKQPTKTRKNKQKEIDKL